MITRPITIISSVLLDAKVPFEVSYEKGTKITVKTAEDADYQTSASFTDHNFSFHVNGYSYTQLASAAREFVQSVDHIIDMDRSRPELRGDLWDSLYRHRKLIGVER